MKHCLDRFYRFYTPAMDGGFFIDPFHCLLHMFSNGEHISPVGNLFDLRGIYFPGGELL